jgi:hypothetical protein
LNLAELFHDIAKLAALAVKYALSERHLSQKAIAELYRSYSRLFASVIIFEKNKPPCVSLEGENYFGKNILENNKPPCVSLERENRKEQA